MYACIRVQDSRVLIFRVSGSERGWSEGEESVRRGVWEKGGRGKKGNKESRYKIEIRPKGR
jgi:hypothetical protein